MRYVLTATAVCAISLSSSARATELAALADLSLEQLGNLEITSVSRQPERLAAAPASIYVITAEDIRRAGVNTLPEALRLAPNLQVARTGSASYAISARGFNNSFGNKLLVLIDGRTVYTPINSGVYWDQQDVMLEDVERIEVISGAGGTTWGANAVNGVINVITRTASATQGALVSAGGGDSEVVGAFRYGGSLGASGHYRVYGKQYKYDVNDSKQSAQNYDWQRDQVGFRLDWDGGRDDFTLQGDFYDAKSGPLDQISDIERRVSGVNILGRWDRVFADGQSLRVQAYYDNTDRDDPVFGDTMSIFDIEMQHGIPMGRHSLLWGAGYRLAEDDTDAGVFFFVPEDRNLHWLNAFVQAKFNLSENVELTAGTRFERNDYTGWEILPSLRLAWTPSASQLLWGAVSRTVRAPARFDRDLHLTLGPFPLIGGGPDFRSEVAVVSELGYRAQPSTDFSFSVTAFHHDYEYLRSGHVPDFILLQPALIDNQMQGTVWGVEAWATYQATSTWRLSAGLTLLREDFSLDPGSDDPDGAQDLGNDPRKQWTLRSSWNISDQCEFDMSVRYVGALELTDPKVESYTAVDARVAWKPSRDLELSLTVQNLLDPGHVEFAKGSLDPSSFEIERSVFAKLLWRM